MDFRTTRPVVMTSFSVSESSLAELGESLSNVDGSTVGRSKNLEQAGDGTKRVNMNM